MAYNIFTHGGRLIQIHTYFETSIHESEESIHIRDRESKGNTRIKSPVSQS